MAQIPQLQAPRKKRMFCTETPPRRHPVESVQTKEGNNSDQSTHPPFSIMARLDSSLYEEQHVLCNTQNAKCANKG